MVTDDTPWLSPVELAAWVGLIRLAARVIALSDGELRRHHDLTGRDYELLHHLSITQDGYRIAQLAEMIDDTSSCITHRVNRLLRSGLVTKQRDPQDQRARRVSVTPAGRALLATAAPGHVRRVRRWIIDALDDDDIRDLGRVTARLNAHLREVAPPDGDGAPLQTRDRHA
jgi:DNA-binding MarR family transcriptional regulator